MKKNESSVDEEQTAPAREQPLSNKQSAFVREYVKDFNATQAAIRAGYSEHTADVQGSRLLTNVKIQREIEKYQQQAKTKTIMDLTELREWWTAVATGEVEGASFGTRVKASELLGRSLGGFTDRVENVGVSTIRVVREDDDE